MSGLPETVHSALRLARDYHWYRRFGRVIALANTGVPDRSVFISYRRKLSWQLARLVCDYLGKHGFDAFMDVKDLDSGEFDRRIFSEIEARMHFIVLLQPGSLDRIGEDGDWLRCEIAHALRHGRNVVPVTAEGFEFRRDLVLPPDVERLPSLQAVEVTSQSELFPATMKLLRKRFLKPKLLAPPRPVTRSVVEPGTAAVSSAPGAHSARSAASAFDVVAQKGHSEPASVMPVSYARYVRELEYNELLILPGYGAARIIVGQHESTIEKRLGVASEITDAPLLGTGRRSQTLKYYNYYRRGISVFVNDNMIKSIFLYGPRNKGYSAFVGATPEGISVNSTRDAIEVVFGPPIEGGGNNRASYDSIGFFVQYRTRKDYDLTAPVEHLGVRARR